jgi:DNA-binding NarL/FixJ family response regulator
MESQTKSRSQTRSSSVKGDESSGESDFVTSAALEAEIKSFCSAHHLTPRECEILGSLVEGVVRIKDIAARMSLSPNTVNNHVNSIFVKTKARSKSQLLSHLLTYVAEELQAARALRRQVRVAIVDADAKASASLVAELKKRGFESASFETSVPMTYWPEGLAAWKPEFVVVDHISMAASEQGALIDRARAFGAQVSFCGQTDNPVSRRNAMANGAIEWFPKPCDPDRLVELFTAHAIPVSDATSVTTRAILFEKKAYPFKIARTPITLRQDQIGAGGVFISNDELMLAMGGAVQAGDWLQFQLNVETRPSTVSARGQVVWRAAEGESPGAGIRFSFLDFETQSWLATVMREQGNRSYIPAGIRR